ncbi:MAG TPA: hypothetical protein VJA21_04975, partial [Verrucomicrobiae bacterium]
LWVPILLGGLGFMGLCRPGEARAAVEHAEIYQRTTNGFAEASFLKPADANTEDLTFKLAPLILEEVVLPTNGPSSATGLGALPPGDTDLAPKPARPVVYVHTDVVVIRGKPHARLGYFWFYPAAPTATSQARPVQGVRLTLNAAGEPVIWEVLADTSGLDLIFVSQNLESAAAAEFGPPLPGRRHAIEAAPAQASKVIVARVLDDGPVPMGPIVYLKSPSRDVLTVICRCMPAQAKKLGRTVEYELRPWPGSSIPRPGAATWLGRADRPLEERLRLPAKF